MCSKRKKIARPKKLWKLKQKRTVLQPYVTSRDHPTDTVCMQETNVVAKPPGYVTQTVNDVRDGCALIRGDIIAIQHILTAGENDYVLTEVIPLETNKDQSILVLDL